MLSCSAQRLDTTLIPPREQYGATLSKVEKRNRLRYGDLQTCATPSNALPHTRNEQVSGSSPLVGSLYALQWH